MAIVEEPPQEHPKGLPSIKRIWWLASYPKSGNTWLRFFLSAYETGTLDINDPSASIGDQQPYFHQVCAPAPLDSLHEYEAFVIRSAAMVHLARWMIGDPLCVKTHMANVQVDNFPLIPWGLTKAAIYVVRDPRDVVISYAHHCNTTIDRSIEMLEDRRNTLVDERTSLKHLLCDWSTHVESWCGKRSFPVLMVRYEDMNSDPVRTFSGVLEYLGLTVDRKRVIKSVDLCRFERLKKQEEKSGFREKVNSGIFFRRGIAGGWRDTLSESQTTRIEAAHHQWMKQLGYLDEHPASRPVQALNVG